MRTVFARFFIVVGLLLATGACLAEEVAKEVSQEAILIPTASHNLRESPPSGIFFTTGDKIATIQSRDTLRVIGTKNVRTLFNTYTWFKVELVNSAGPDTDSVGSLGTDSAKPWVGWVYGGKADEPTSFQVRPPLQVQQLSKAIEEGNLETAQQLVGEIEAKRKEQ
ncbi:MAG: hypothetical protein GY867_01220 [bacterium]|nr:hypothetical protein [bacterium]